MGDKKKKISGLPLAQSLVGLYTIGVNAANDSVRVSLEWLKTAYDNVMSAISNANRATESANTAAGKANKAATDAGAQMTQISQEASAAIKAATDAAGNAQEAADNVQDGKTTQFEIGTVESGAAPSASLTDNGVDATGNPKKKLNLVMQKGDNAKSPTVQTGTITAGDPASEVTFTFAEVGMTEDGRPIWRVDGAIPRGQQGPPGAGSGNVSVDGTGLVIGKKYLFVPSSDDSTAGTFVEYVAPEIPEQVQPDWNATEGKGAILHKPGDATADASGLMSADQFQKLEKLSPSYLSNDVTGKKVEYTDDGKLLFEGKDTFAVDADGELTLDGKKMSELGGGQKGLDIAGLFLAALANPTEQFPVSQDIFNAVVEAYENYVQFAYAEIEGQPKQSFILSISYNTANEEFFYNVSVFLPIAMGGMIGYCDYNVMTFTIYEDRKICKFNSTNIRFEVDGDGTKALMNDGTYKVIGRSSAQYLDLSPLFDSEGSPVAVTTEDFINKVKDTVANHVIVGFLNGVNVPIVIQTSGEYYIISASSSYTDNNYDNATYHITWTIQLSDRSVVIRQNEDLNVVSGYGTKFKSDNGTYKEVPIPSTPLATTSANGLMSSDDKKKLDRIGSYTTATTVANLNANYENIEISNLSTNASLSVNLVGTTYNGWDINVFIYCSSARTITIPTSGNYISMIGSSLSCPAGKWTELNLHCSGGKWRIAKLEQE